MLQAKWFKVMIMIGCMIVTALTLHRFAKLVQHLVSVNYSWQFEMLMVTGMLFFQYLFIYKYSWSQKLDYYFNMLFVSLIGSVLLFPLLALNKYLNCSDTFILVYFFAVVLIMFFEHKIRVTKLKLPALISYTWVLYRIIILIFIL